MERLLLALEQFYILSLNPLYNDLLVIGSPPGGKWLSEVNSVTNSTPISMFLNGVLIYTFNSMVGHTNSALSILHVKSNTLIDRLNTGELLWNQFTFTRGNPTPEQEANGNILTLEGLLELIAEAKVTFKKTYVRKPAGRPKSTTPPVTITRVSDGSQFHFENFNSARIWLLENAQTNVSNDTIRRRIKSGIQLNGFIYKPGASKLPD